MKINISKKFENPLMNRTKIFFEAKHDAREATPSRKQIKDILTAKLGANKELLVIESIIPHMGTNASEGVAFLYKDKMAFDRLAREYLKKRDEKEPKAKKAEAPTEEKPAEEAKPEEEVKAEEPKEEKKEEAKYWKKRRK